VLQVVSEAGPQHLHLHLSQATHVKLSQPELAFDPRVAKFHDSSTAAVRVEREEGEREIALLVGNPVDRKFVQYPRDWPWSSWSFHAKGAAIDSD
jgi:hypothetical protein